MVSTKLIGYRLAQFGAVLMVLGGLGDVIVAGLLPAHEVMIAADLGAAREGVSRLVTALLRALGAALMATGIAVFMLVRISMSSGRKAPLIAAGTIALLGEGVNAYQMYRVASPYYLAPAAFAGIVIMGVLTAAAAGEQMTAVPVSHNTVDSTTHET